MLEIGKKAEGKLSLDVGFQIRMAPPFMELVKRIHAGALGEIVSGAAHYYCPRIDLNFSELAAGHAPAAQLAAGPRALRRHHRRAEYPRHRHLQLDAARPSGEGRRPERQEGPQSSRATPAPRTSMWCFEYPNDVHVSFSSTQFGKGQFDVNERFFGTRGSSQSPYAGPLGVWGEEQWVWGGQRKAGGGAASSRPADRSRTTSREADSEKQKAFISSITSGKFHNQAAAGVESALTAMLGRQAAYQGHELTWDELLRSNEHWDPGIDLNKLG